ncbi:GrpB family protein [Litorihabitans aurantiacus]|uniref:GrpB family protein n=1 Tax=Litorihabitans aurantiacus TaxID=1930061 RepID=UPI0024E12134|nr:GrpB family protein [Litorihabitans aurantiacus]
MTTPSNPAALSPPDPTWPVRAEGVLAVVRAALADLPGGGAIVADHIGSTAVPGLAAKPYLDLQVRILPLPDDAAVAARLVPLGWARAEGSRPDSPGVNHDVPRGSAQVPAKVWAKSLWFHAEEAAVLHVRRTDSPWGRYTVAFRDWLRAHDGERRRYETVKRELAAREIGKADYDDYTRAKTAHLDEVQAAFEVWAGLRPDGPR